MENLNIVLCFIYCLLFIIIVLFIASYFLKFNIPNIQKWVICFLFLDFAFNLFVVADASNTSNISILFGMYLTVFITFILAIILSLYHNKQINYIRIFRNIRSFSVFLLIISIGYIIVRLMVHKFNSDSLWINENNISDSIENWGNFATFFGGIFTLISIYLAYRAFISQVNTSRRASFDATFTQIFAQHKALHNKAVRHNIIRRTSIGTTDIFTICRIVFERVYSNDGFITIRDFYERFNSHISPYIGLYSNIEARNELSCVSVDFKNYFKYIYHEINIVVNQPYEVLDDEAKRRYIQLIQAQMNYDELFCYLLNQVEYLNYWIANRETNEIAFNAAMAHAENLRNYDFFYELCKSRSGHNALVRNIMMYNRDEVSRLIRNEWLS